MLVSWLREWELNPPSPSLWDSCVHRLIFPAIYFFVARTRVELVFTGWKPGVLTDRRTGHLLAPTTRFELVTQRLTAACSTTELRRHICLSFQAVNYLQDPLAAAPSCQSSYSRFCPFCWIRTNLLTLYSGVATPGDIKVIVFYHITLRMNLIIKMRFELIRLCGLSDPSGYSMG